jgi:hypothetical protein
MIYVPDPWHEGGAGEKFYTEAFAGGVCKYCGSPGKEGRLALCECPGLISARFALKLKLYGPQAQVATKDNPNRNIEPISYEADEPEKI